MEGQLVAKDGEMDKLHGRLAHEARERQYLQDVEAITHAENVRLEESVAGLQAVCEEVRNDLTLKNEECDRLQQMVTKLRTGNQLLDVAASRLHEQRDAARSELEASRRDKDQLQDTVARLVANEGTQAIRITGLRRRIADKNAKAKLYQEASRQVYKIKKHWAIMTELVGSFGTSKVRDMGSEGDDLIVLDD